MHADLTPSPSRSTCTSQHRPCCENLVALSSRLTRTWVSGRHRPTPTVPGVSSNAICTSRLAARRASPDRGPCQLGKVQWLTAQVQGFGIGTRQHSGGRSRAGSGDLSPTQPSRETGHGRRRHRQHRRATFDHARSRSRACAARETLATNVVWAWRASRRRAAISLKVRLRRPSSSRECTGTLLVEPASSDSLPRRLPSAVRPGA